MKEIENNTSHEEKFVHANPNPVLSSSADGVLLFANPAASKLILELELEQIEDLLPADHKGLVKACLMTRMKLSGECDRAEHNIVWSYQCSDEKDVVYLYGYDVSKYQADNLTQNLLPKADPNPVISSSVDGIFNYFNPAVTKLLEDLHLTDIEDLLPLDHKGLLHASAVSRMILTEENNIDGRALVWTYKSFEDSDEIFIYGHDLKSCNSKMFCTEALPRSNPSPVLSVDEKGGPTFINNAALKLLEKLELGSIEDLLPPDHIGMVKACLTTNTALTTEYQVKEKTMVWSYHPVNAGDIVYIYGHDITDYCKKSCG